MESFALTSEIDDEKKLRDEWRKYDKREQKRRRERYAKCDAWILLEKYFDLRSPVERQLSSYNWV